MDVALAKAWGREDGIRRKVERGQRSYYRSRKEREAESKSKKGPPGNTVAFLPYCKGVDAMCKELNRDVKKLQLPLVFKSKGGRMLHYTFAPPSESRDIKPPACNPTQLDEKFWGKQGNVYLHKCIAQGCPENSGQYIGQTGREQHARNKDHARACKNGQHKLSAFVEHYDQYHTVEGVRQPLQIETQLLATGLAYCKRCITEAIEVADRNPALNRNQPCVATTKLYIDLTEDERKGLRRRIYE